MIDVSLMKEAGIVGIRDVLIEQQRQGRAVARTESGDPAFDVPEIARVAMERALASGKTHYTAAAGIPELRQAIVAKLARENALEVDLGGVFVTAGAMNGLFVVFGGLLHYSDKREVLVPTPTWTETVTNIELNGGQPVFYDVDPFSEPSIDIEQIAARITPQTAAVVINTPHNPTGAVLGRETLAALAALCEQRGIYLISDEAYEHVIFTAGGHYSVAALTDYPRVVSIYSCSKSYAMSGLRVGYVATKDKALRQHFGRYLRCTANGVNSVAQHGAAAAIADGAAADIAAMMVAYRHRRGLLYRAVCSCSVLDPVEPSGAFYVWARIKDFAPIAAAAGKEIALCDGWDATGFFLEHGVGSAPGECFGPGGQGAIRFSFSCPDEHVELAASALARL